MDSPLEMYSKFVLVASISDLVGQILKLIWKMADGRLISSSANKVFTHKDLLRNNSLKAKDVQVFIDAIYSENNNIAYRMAGKFDGNKI